MIRRGGPAGRGGPFNELEAARLKPKLEDLEKRVSAPESIQN